MSNLRVGRLAIVLHSHLPWLLGYGTWPVGEEWLRQAWAHSYVRVLNLLHERAEQGRASMLTLGVTPVLAAQWDDPNSIAEQHRWIADWRIRAMGKAIEARRTGDDIALADAHRHHHDAVEAEELLAHQWASGGSPLVRTLVDSGAIELLGGPITHTFTPHLIEPIANLAFASGLDDTTVRIGKRPSGIWAPECAYRPGLEDFYARHHITHFMVDGPTLQAANPHLHRPHRVGASDVVAYARDLSLTYRVWSPRSGYPGNSWYQDFHTFDHDWGLRSSRVTKRTAQQKRPYEPEAAAARAAHDAEDFLQHARKTLIESPEDDPVVVVAYDTELFGHWWHEGPMFLEHVIDGAHEAGIELTTLERERSRAMDNPGVELPEGSWGSGKDFGVWEQGEAGDLLHRGRGAQYAVAKVLRESGLTGRDGWADVVATELLLALASDWAFMITKDSAADYARGRANVHFDRVAELLRSGHHGTTSSKQPCDRRLPFVDARLAHTE